MICWMATINPFNDLLKYKAIPLVGFTLLMLPFFAWSSQCENMYAVGSNHASPIAYTDEATGQPKGVVYNLMSEISRELRIPVQFLTGVAWSRANAWLDEGEIDLLLGVYKSHERESKWLFSIPFLLEGTGIYKLEGKLVDINEFHQLQGLRGGAIHASSYGNRIDAELSKLDIFYTTSELELFKMLLVNRLDYVISAQWDAHHVLGKLGAIQQVSSIDALAQTNSLHIAFNKNGPCTFLLEEINRLIIQNQQMGKIDSWLTTFMEEKKEGHSSH